MDCHLHISAGSSPCDHVKITLHRSSNDAFLGKMVTTKAALKAEITDFDTAREKVIAQIEGIVLANPDATPAQLKKILESAVIRI